VNVTWLLHLLDEKNNGTFTIDRQAPKCKTPRRNKDIEGARAFFASWYAASPSFLLAFVLTFFPSKGVMDEPSAGLLRQHAAVEEGGDGRRLDERH
jgi:hypothetical protein